MKTNFEYRKGVLFIRLSGILTKETVNNFQNELNQIINDSGIVNIVLNIEKISNIDQKGIHLLYYLYELVLKRNGNILICSNINENVRKKLKGKRILNYIHEINNELDAFKLIHV